jgi:hypothetical protein
MWECISGIQILSQNYQLFAKSEKLPTFVIATLILDFPMDSGSVMHYVRKVCKYAHSTF